MKKRIGSKLYDTDNGIKVLQDPETGKDLYKQQNKRTFYLFDGEQITPLTFDQAEEMIKAAGSPDLLQHLEIKADARGCTKIGVTVDHYNKIQAYAARRGLSIKNLIESYIDSLPED